MKGVLSIVNHMNENSKYVCIFHGQHVNTGTVSTDVESDKERADSNWMPQTIDLKKVIHRYLLIISPLVIKKIWIEKLTWDIVKQNYSICFLWGET